MAISDNGKAAARLRDVLTAAVAALAAPRLARAQGGGTLRFIPQIDLAFLDPHFTTAYVTRGHGHMVFDTLYGQDGSFRASPQMVEGHAVEDGGKLWTLCGRSPSARASSGTTASACWRATARRASGAGRGATRSAAR